MQDQRHRPRRFTVTGALIVIFLALTVGAVSPAGAAPVAAGSSAGLSTVDRLLAAPDDDTVAGISVTDVVNDLADDHVAVIGSGADPAALASIAAEARSNGVNLSIVSLSTRLTNDDARLLAEKVRSRVHGTVLVLTPTSGGQDSDELSGTKQDDAKAAAAAAGGDDVAAARAYMESATAKAFPWSLVIIGVIILVVIGAIVYGVIGRNRKKKADHDALADLTRGLSKRIETLAPLMLSIPPRIDLAKRPDLEDRFNRAGAEYTKLRDLVATPLGSRREVDATATDVAALEKTLDDIDQQLDVLLPGLEPPSPAG